MGKEKHKKKGIWDIIRLVLVIVLTIIFLIVDVRYIQTGKGLGINKGSAQEPSVTISTVADLTCKSETQTEEQTTIKETEGVEADDNKQQEELEPVTEGEAVNEADKTEGVLGNLPEKEEVIEESTEATIEFVQAPEGYFDDALFIGDSRTVGLYEYGGIGGAEFFATSGMSVFRANYEKVDMGDKGVVSGIDGLINNYTYGKIYIMLGINELGYPAEEFQEGYIALLDKIRQAQPQAVIYVLANLHISEARSKADEIYNNENLNSFNAFIETLADNKEIFFLDVNILFDDENGYLRADITNDGAHTQGRYYREWADWLATKAVVK